MNADARTQLTFQILALLQKCVKNRKCKHVTSEACIGDWKDMSIAHVIIIIKSEVSTFPIVIIFFHGCVSEMFVTSYSVTYCIYIPGKPGIWFNYYCAVYDECKQSDTFWLEDRIRLFVHYTISLSSLHKLIWRHWTYKMPVRYSLSSVWVR